MTTFNRNVITRRDVAAFTAATTPGELPKTLDGSPPAGVASGPGGVPVPTEDDYLTRLLKYVPLEVVGAYLFVAGVVDTNVKQGPDHQHWLLAVFVLALVATAGYDIRVLNVVRFKQVFLSLLGLTVYVFSMGGWFAATTWYHQWYASIALPAFALLAAIVKLKPLPPATP